MHTTNMPPGFHPVRRDQLRVEREHDTYKLQAKLPGTAVCPDCGAVFQKGRWQWSSRRPAGATEFVCAACHRIRDRFPAGFVRVDGPYFLDHQNALTALIRHHEAREKTEHPMARLIAIEPVDDGVLVSTTDIHLARDIGEALHHAHQGELEFHYNEGEKLLRVHWHR